MMNLYVYVSLKEVVILDLMTQKSHVSHEGLSRPDVPFAKIENLLV